jgi:hypothetical protein
VTGWKTAKFGRGRRFLPPAIHFFGSTGQTRKKEKDANETIAPRGGFDLRFGYRGL